MALVCAIVPVLIMSLAMIFTARGGTLREQELISQVESAVNDQARLSVEAQASRIDSQMASVGISVQLITAHTQEALTIPEAFSDQQPPAAPGASTTTAPPKPVSSAKPEAGPTGHAADNPLFYAKMPNGALRKVIDDGGPTVFYAKRADRDFTRYEMQRMYSTATLDPLLKQAVEGDPLCTQSYILTEDNLLRTFPPVDFSNWPGDKDLTGLPMFAWAPKKADTSGTVWTSPYFSQLLNEWVVACLGGVMLGDRIVAVAGIEIPLNKLGEQFLGFSLGTGSLGWIQRGVDANTAQLLAAQSGAESLLAASALAKAPSPTEDRPGQDIIKDANLLASAGALHDLLAVEPGQLKLEMLSGSQEGKMLALAPLAVQQWSLGVVIQSEAIATVRRYQRYVDTRLMQRMAIAVCTLLIGIGLALAMGWLEARRISHPLLILQQQLRLAQTRQSRTPVLISDEGEIGALAKAVQELVDNLHASADEHPPAPPTAPTD
jgi:hypothetical protein